MLVDISSIAEGVGTLNNLISVDVKDVSFFVSQFHESWSSVYEICLCLFLLHLVLGVAIFGGFLIMVLMVPIGSIGSRYMGVYQGQLLKVKDERMNVINEVLTGIRIIKVISRFINNLIF
jgi:hypothetical protein